MMTNDDIFAAEQGCFVLNHMLSPSEAGSKRDKTPVNVVIPPAMSSSDGQGRSGGGADIATTMHHRRTPHALGAGPLRGFVGGGTLDETKCLTGRLR